MSEPRVVVTRAVLGICHMQVCAAKDATDTEVLGVANRENPSGTTNGWTTVIRSGDESKKAPVACQQNPERLHLLLVC